MNRRNAVAAWIGLLCVAQGGLHAATVAGWLFEGTDGQPAGEVTNSAVPGTLTGVATNVLDGTIPVYTTTVPGTNIWDGLSGPLYHADNQTALEFSGNGLTGGVIRVADDPDRTRPESVTFEAFIKARTLIQGGTVAKKVRAGTGASWWLYTTSSGGLTLRIDTAGGGEGAVSLTATTAGLGDGKWHHVAFTYAGWNTNAVLYVDYVAKTSKKLLTPPLDYDGGDLLIGHDGAGGSFDGWIDEVRVSDKALGLSQFLYVIEDRFVSDGVLLHYTFDSEAAGSNVGAVTNVAQTDLLNGTAVKTGTGSTQPQYAADRPDDGRYTVVDGKGGEPLHYNRSAIRMWGPAAGVGGRVETPWPRTVVSLTNLTVEAFVKPDWPASFAGIFRKARSGISNPTFALSVTTNTSGVSLTGRFDTELPTGPAGFNETFTPTKTVNLRDGRWHHVALTYAHPEKRARMYVDYVEVGTRTTTNPLVYEGGDFIIGTSGTSYYDGWIDEVRVTGRVLSTNEFLRTTLRGTLIRME
ncbi:MAG: LamG domain-containing protein [Kiritimatiellia bacterium]|jgi:hypothetical protein|nr:LamG domain-containing protein [Kiritimatiellia bacterium]